MRASSVAERQRTSVAFSFRSRSKAAISRARTFVSGMRRSGHWLERIATSNWALPLPLSDVFHQVSREEPLVHVHSRIPRRLKLALLLQYDVVASRVGGGRCASAYLERATWGPCTRGYFRLYQGSRSRLSWDAIRIG